MVTIVPPHGFKLEFGDTAETVTGMFLSVAAGSTGISPLSSVTTGYQPLPATGVTVQVSCEDDTYWMFSQGTCEKRIELTLLGRFTPLIVRVVPECVKELIEAIGATYLYPHLSE